MILGAVQVDQKLRDHVALVAGVLERLRAARAAQFLDRSHLRSKHVSAKKVGAVTSALHDLAPGETVGIRGPYGNWFPHEDLCGKNLLFVGGGIGMAPLRSLLNFCLDRRSDYGHIDIFYGARTPGDLCYTYEFDEWRQAPDTSLYLIVAAEARGSGALIVSPSRP